MPSPSTAVPVPTNTAVMIGRAAQGRPWLFREIEHYLATGELLPAPRVIEIHTILRQHLADLYAFYGEDTGVKIARKHIAWYTKGLSGAATFRHAMNQLATVDAQLQATDDFFLSHAAHHERLSYDTPSPEFPDEVLAA